ncbi:ATP-binding protein [Arthrobacter jiangjiafuii]|uniref:ATP-binding protein n=2 Tax=Arthrobacter jiangjiafuii TaxID=2817475 RepID=A0A975QZU6_9MICC|nr:ATP-binding protein [Arthrobacter jiangjiafuii]MBP3043182.1 ATP-binding protein [Arthrobacter jiangjiafuii]QWC08734.1 ATP-binding protein [Arthrobacter jiangjiafuii]
MHSATNPYSPGAGRKPFELSGRTALMNDFDLLVSRAAAGRTDRGIVLHGLHGVGKTVLLNDFRRRAEDAGFLVVSLEGRDAGGGPKAVRAKLARGLLQAGRKAHSQGNTPALAAALGTITSFADGLQVGGIDVGVGSRHGRGDSGEFAVDLEETVEDISLALAERRSALIIVVDEMQNLDPALLSALLGAQHQAGQRDWPFYLVAAGLPNLPATLNQSQRYAEGLFTYRRVGALDREDAGTALAAPARELGVSYEPEALDLLLNAAGGYPYFLQEYGSAAWESAPRELITAADARVAVEIGRAQLDQGFFPMRWRRATKAEREFLRLMAMDGAAGSGTATLAARAGKKMTSMTMTRGSLIRKGIIYAPSLGQVAFTVPGMAEYVQRVSSRP